MTHLDGTDRALKRERITRILHERGAESVLLTSDAALAWYLDGSRTHISLAAPPILSVRVGRDGDTAFVTSNEVERLLAEELPDDVAVSVRDWHELPQVQDRATLDESAISRELRLARRCLLPGETARFRQLGGDAAAVLTDVLTNATPDVTERGLAGRVASRLIALGADPLVLLVSGESRASYRHPLPTDAPIGRRAMVVVCARRAGLIANVTRWVRFGAATAAESDWDSRILDVEATAFAATRPGAELRNVLTAIQIGYEAAGFDRAEWTRHHQGGPAGYAGRDPRADPRADDEVVDHQAFAWNPTGNGAKVEDTVLITAGMVEVLTYDSRWPTRNIGGIPRPEVLEL